MFKLSAIFFSKDLGEVGEAKEDGDQVLNIS
jgi:hypothetical protein